MARPARVAIVGAGMAGASAARHLADAGFRPTLFDKGRQVGGRMAHRHDPTTGFRFDHGAQVMRALNPAFRARLAAWQAAGLVAPWDAERSVAAVPDMTAPVRHLLAGLEVHVARTVTGFERDAAGWRLSLAEAEEERVFDALVITTPGPQAIRIFDAAGLSLPGIERAAYAPCWSLMLAGAGDLPFATEVLLLAEGPIGAIFRESTKPGRVGATPCFTVHAAPDWSRAHLEDSREAVQAALLSALGTLSGTPIAPGYVRVHRWRYALVETHVGETCLYDSERRVGYCGDGCLGPRIEAAYDSGAALAERIIADLT